MLGTIVATVVAAAILLGVPASIAIGVPAVLIFIGAGFARRDDWSFSDRDEDRG